VVITRIAAITAALLLVASLEAVGQPAGKGWRIGVLGYDGTAQPELREGLDSLGYVDGQNTTILFRNAEGRSERLPGLAADLVRLKVDIIVAIGTAPSRAAKEATATIPIVMAPADDPVGTGLVVSLARPGGNITGLSVLSWDADAKRVQLLREVVPNLVRVAVLWNPTNPGHRQALKQLEEPTRSIRIELYPTTAPGADELEKAFSRMVQGRVGAVVVLGDALFYAQRAKILQLAARNSLPAMYFRREFVEAGGLLSYGTGVPELRKRAAYFVDKILKGAKPGDLPVEQPTKFELVINLRTAKSLGLTILLSLLSRADEVIQ
jgi:putative ABC transport system substrate-binding protein